MNDEPGSHESETNEQARRQDELAAFEKLVERARKGMRELGAAATNEQLREVVDKAAADLRRVGEHSTQTVGKVAESLKKDMASSAEILKPRFEALGKEVESTLEGLRQRGGALWAGLAEDTEQVFSLWRDRATAAMAAAALGMADLSRRVGERLDETLTYHTGELTHGGQFACTECGATVTLKKPGHLPPCPRCHKTAFRRA
jgi:hypothetical protein